MRNKISKLWEELKYTKTILRYPKLYTKYHQKKFEEIKRGLETVDKHFIQTQKGNKDQ